MAIGLFINMMVAYLISDVFLQLVEKWGYAPVLFMLAGFAVVYFLTAAFFLPENADTNIGEYGRVRMYFFWVKRSTSTTCTARPTKFSRKLSISTR